MVRGGAGLGPCFQGDWPKSQWMHSDLRYPDLAARGQQGLSRKRHCLPRRVGAGPPWCLVPLPWSLLPSSSPAPARAVTTPAESRPVRGSCLCTSLPAPSAQTDLPPAHPQTWPLGPTPSLTPSLPSLLPVLSGQAQCCCKNRGVPAVGSPRWAWGGGGQRCWKLLQEPKEKPQGDPGPRSMGLEGQETAGQPQDTLLPTLNGSGSIQELAGHWPEIPERSPCVAGVAPIIYYSVLLGLGLPVNLLSTVALARLAARTRKSSYHYLLALTASDIATQVVIVFMGFLLQGAMLAREVPRAVVHTANILEFAANHASVWLAVLLTVDRYGALCHPLHHRAISSPGRTHRAIATVLGVALLTGIPFYWWPDVWRDADPPSTMDKVLKWAHCLVVYFIPCGVFLGTNSAIVCRLRQRTHSGLRPRGGKSTAILLGVTTLFALLWAPRIFVMLFHLYVAPVHRDWRVHLALDVANMVAMLSTAVNFGLYCCVSKTFRAAVREVIREAHLSCTLRSQPVGAMVWSASVHSLPWNQDRFRGPEQTLQLECPVLLGNERKWPLSAGRQESGSP
ncbi:putative G-protein coupled receptor 142 [Tamandua tetradactyla]|uniref:putative G-protein coupled receptor 142 n=1 Tax=Tamandua tetradactyla TaxID=48850 RepID=UPI0040541602